MKPFGSVSRLKKIEQSFQPDVFRRSEKRRLNGRYARNLESKKLINGMIGYITLGTNDLKRATEFYDELFKELGVKRAYENSSDEFVAWSFNGSESIFIINKPFNKNPATVGNGVMVALRVEEPETVDKLHAKALNLGGTNEGDPGNRGGDFYGGYFRDLDGNKLNFYCHTSSIA